MSYRSSRNSDSQRKSRRRNTDGGRLDARALGVARGELIGLDATVVESTDPGLAAVAGRVVDETRNMLVIERSGRPPTRAAKVVCVFEFRTPDGLVRIDGRRLRYRPEDRTKKVR